MNCSPNVETRNIQPNRKRMQDCHQIISAVHFMQSKGVVHRDLKPEVSIILVFIKIKIRPGCKFYSFKKDTS